MYLVIFLFLFFTPSLSFSQNISINDKIAIKIDGLAFEDALAYIEGISGYSFAYNSDLIPTNNKVSFNSKDVILGSFLKTWFSNLGLDYKVAGETIVIIKSTKVNNNVIVKSVPTKKEPATKLSQNKPDTKVIMVYDTVRTYVNDTIFKIVYDTIDVMRYDTIIEIHFDTSKVVVIDTLFITKDVPQELEVKSKTSENSGWLLSAGGLSYFTLTESFQFRGLQFSDSVLYYYNSVKGYGAEINLEYRYKNISFQSGFQLEQDYLSLQNVYFTNYIDSNIVVDWNRFLVGYDSMTYSINGIDTLVFLNNSPIWDSTQVYHIGDTLGDEIRDIKVTRFTLPIRIGYNIKLPALSSEIGMYAGMNISYISSMAGDYINDEYTLVNYKKQDYQKVTFSLHAVLRYTYFINQWGIYVQPTYAYINNQSFKNHVIQNNVYHKFSFGIGLTYKF